MHNGNFRSRLKLAGGIRVHRAAVAEEVTTEFLTRHPEWLTRYGDRARQFGIQDATYHLDFLAASIESGEIQAFQDYAAWAARMLAARHIEPAFLAETLNQIGHALGPRLSTADAITVDGFIRSGIDGCRVDLHPAEEATGGRFDELTRIYTEAAIHGHRQAALNLLLEAVRQGHPIIDIYSEVLQRAMYRMGQLWEENRITVSQEHMGTAITQFVISRLYPLIDSPPVCRGRIVITGVQGEFHQVGAHLVADVLEANGWDVRFLGTDAPVSGVLEAVAEHKADILGISATMLFNIPGVTSLVEAVHARLGTGLPIILGGGAFRSAPLLYKELGANGCSLDLQSAVALADEFTTPAHSTKAKSILITDDDAKLRLLFRTILEEAGYQVLEAGNGKEALSILRERPVHVVLIDLVMPEQEGLETIPRIHGDFPDTRIIAMSGFSGPFLRAARALGASEAIEKPIRPAELLNTVRKVLEIV